MQTIEEEVVSFSNSDLLLFSPQSSKEIESYDEIIILIAELGYTWYISGLEKCNGDAASVDCFSN